MIHIQIPLQPPHKHMWRVVDTRGSMPFHYEFRCESCGRFHKMPRPRFWLGTKHWGFNF